MTNKDPMFIVSRQEQESILNGMDEPNDLIDRSYKQFRCQYLLMGREKHLYQFGSFFVLKLKKLRIKTCTEEENTKKGLVCVLGGINKNLVPKQLLDKYKDVSFCVEYEHSIITESDIIWFNQNIASRYPKEWLFQLKIFLRMTQYRFLIETYHPKAIAIHDEYSCSSSAMTAFCNINHVEHIDFMHGEKLWYIRDSFFEFNECYVWNEHYISMFRSLRAAPQQFIIDLPPVFSERPDVIYEDIVDFCYYLGEESQQEIITIFDFLSKLKQNEFSVRVRPHHRYTNKYKV